MAQNPSEILATSARAHAVWRRSHNCKVRRSLRIREYGPFLLEEKSLWKKRYPALLEERGCRDSQLPLSCTCVLFELDGLTLEPVLEGPVAEERSKENASRAPVSQATLEIGGREISLCACSRRIPDIPQTGSSALLVCAPFTRPRLRIPSRRRPK